jgi:hypothetical protein
MADLLYCLRWTVRTSHLSKRDFLLPETSPRHYVRRSSNIEYSLDCRTGSSDNLVIQSDWVYQESRLCSPNSGLRARFCESMRLTSNKAIQASIAPPGPRDERMVIVAPIINMPRYIAARCYFNRASLLFRRCVFGKAWQISRA